MGNGKRKIRKQENYKIKVGEIEIIGKLGNKVN